ncbi:MAG: DUF3553 domain-containing protein [Planctomycetota bacterium]|nr:DUF3553 domain-containing protein [Planctomycetota bacterium]
MSSERFEFGDRVRHTERPEWGIGSVLRAEEVSLNGRVAQRLSVRFSGVGVKKLVTGEAPLKHVAEETATVGDDDQATPLAEWDKVSSSEWLGPLARRKIEETMIALPAEARDPFASVARRLGFVLNLYRFDRSGRGLIDWAVAQSGLDDPLTRFNRHELEQYFDRWAVERDAQLGRLLQEAAFDSRLLEHLLAQAPPDAERAVRRLMAVR